MPDETPSTFPKGKSRFESFTYSRYASCMVIQRLKDYFTSCRFLTEFEYGIVFPFKIVNRYMHVEFTQFEKDDSYVDIPYVVGIRAHLTSSFTINIPGSSLFVIDNSEYNKPDIDAIEIADPMKFSVRVIDDSGENVYVVKIFHDDLEITIMEPVVENNVITLTESARTLVIRLLEEQFDKASIKNDDTFTSVIIPQIRNFKYVEEVDGLKDVEFSSHSLRHKISDIKKANEFSIIPATQLPFATEPKNEKKLVIDGRFLLWVSLKGSSRCLFTGFFDDTEFIQTEYY